LRFDLTWNTAIGDRQRRQCIVEIGRVEAEDAAGGMIQQQSGRSFFVPTLKAW
jgi:hypothetical protein